MTQGNGKTVFTEKDCEQQLAALRLQQEENAKRMLVVLERMETVAEKLAKLPCLQIRNQG